VRTLDKFTFDVYKTEKIIKEHEDIVEDFTWVTAKMHEFAGSTISSTNLEDMVGYPFQVIEIQGIMPNYFETIVPGFVVEHYSHLDQKKGWLYPLIGHPEASDLSFGELLYTPRGS
jgi:hypothetical protein